MRDCPLRWRIDDWLPDGGLSDGETYVGRTLSVCWAGDMAAREEMAHSNAGACMHMYFLTRVCVQVDPHEHA